MKVFLCDDLCLLLIVEQIKADLRAFLVDRTAPATDIQKRTLTSVMPTDEPEIVSTFAAMGTIRGNRPVIASLRHPHESAAIHPECAAVSRKNRCALLIISDSHNAIGLTVGSYTIAPATTRTAAGTTRSNEE